MKQPTLRVAVLALFYCAALSASAQLSQRVVDYQIEARFDSTKKTLIATEVLTYRNLTGQPLAEFPFHLYLNAFQPQSTFMREVKRDSPDFKWEEKYRASIEVTSFEVVGLGDMKSQLRFIAPDDGNTEDRTVVQVRLPRPVPPGGAVQFKIGFRDQFGEVFARTGYKRSFFMVAQWFPKIGVFWRGDWNCHQFHAATEFFADFGTYDVKVTMPADFVAGSSGDVVSETRNSDGTKTLAWRGEDIHDFAWTADPNFHVVEDFWQGTSGSGVKIRLLVQPTHYSQAQRYISSLKGTLRLFDQWFGSYPYNRVTVVDPAPGALRAGGMEYPTLFTAGTTWWMPDGVRFPEVVSVHEFGHQYWYGMVANNEFEESWLDEGINQYSEIKVMQSLYGENSILDVWGLTANDGDVSHMGYSAAPDRDPISRPAFRTMSWGSTAVIAYDKPAMVFLTLEGLLGEEVMRRVLRAFFERYRFQHPTGEDLLNIAQEVSRQDLRWYFDQAIRGTQVLDYEVLSARSGEKESGTQRCTTHVVVHRKGDFVFPVEVAIRFDNGEVRREHWDGRDRWVRFSYEMPAKLVSAEVDPDHKVWLDVDRFNNGRTVAAQAGPSGKLSLYWLMVVQFLAQAVAWLV